MKKNFILERVDSFMKSKILVENLVASVKKDENIGFWITTGFAAGEDINLLNACVI